MSHPVVVDFETEGIDGAPAWRPPKPIGVAIKFPSQKPTYFGWSKGDNEQLHLARAALSELWHDPKKQLLFHNAVFDLSVAWRWLDLPWPEWHRIHDTLLLAYLYEPDSPSLHLKDLGERMFQTPPRERDALKEWMLEHGHTEKTYMANLKEAPHDLLARYAKQDTILTAKLFETLHRRVLSKGMGPAYDRERQLLQPLAEATRRGVRINRDRLDRDSQKVATAIFDADTKIQSMLGAPDLNVDSNNDLADALEKAGKVREWGYTEKGHRKTSREALIHCLNDAVLAHFLAYRGQLATVQRTFMEPWLAMTEADGRLHPTWHQTRGEDKNGGTRTGRLSSDHPNFQNIPGDALVEAPPGWLPIPAIRSYVLPEDGEVFVAADFDSQELRGLAHYAEGPLEKLYNDDPRADVHATVQEWVKQRTGRELTRKAVKIINFSLIYGAGAASIAKRLGTTPDEAAQLMNAILDSMPGVRSLRKELQDIGERGEHVRTWGSRLLRAPLGPDGRRKGYAMVNYLIQGSCADITKEAIVAFTRSNHNAKLLATVHDEMDASIPIDHLENEIVHMKEAMTSMQGLSVPLTVTVKAGPNWGALDEYHE
jgi:DNA polymerase I